MINKEISKHVFCFNSQDNGGEQLTLVTKFYDNGDKENNTYTDQELTLNSYCNSASFTLSGAQITPDALRKLADELDSHYEKLKGKLIC